MQTARHLRQMLMMPIKVDQTWRWLILSHFILGTRQKLFLHLSYSFKANVILLPLLTLELWRWFCVFFEAIHHGDMLHFSLFQLNGLTHKYFDNLHLSHIWLCVSVFATCWHFNIWRTTYVTILPWHEPCLQTYHKNANPLFVLHQLSSITSYKDPLWETCTFLSSSSACESRSEMTFDNALINIACFVSLDC